MTFEISNIYGTIEYFSNDYEMTRQVTAQKIFEQDFVLTQIAPLIQRKQGVVLDIGAHCGSHTLLYKRVNPDLRVLAFEPQKKMFDLLVRNVARNNLQGVQCYNVALGHYNGEAEMNGFSYDGPNSLSTVSYDDGPMYNLAGLQIGEHGEKVKMRTLDSLFAYNLDWGDEEVVFMKIDVEGYEPYVLQGAELLIQGYSPIICFEYNHKRSNSYKTSFEVLDEYGYTYRKLYGENWIATKEN